MFVGRFRLGQLAGLPVHIEVALAGAVDAVGPVKSSVEPLRRVRRHHLPGQHEAQLVIERAGVLFGGIVAALPAPVGPAAGEAIEHLLGGELAAEALGLGEVGHRFEVGHRAPQPRRHGFFLDLLQHLGDAGLAEILLGEHVGGDLGPHVRHLDIVEPEHHRSVGIANLAGRQPELNVRVGGLAVLGVAPIDPHSLLAPSCAGVRSLATPDRFHSRTLPPAVPAGDPGSIQRPNCQRVKPRFARLWGQKPRFSARRDPFP